VGTETAFSGSWLIRMVTLPLGTSWDLANRIRATNVSTMVVNMITPRTISSNTRHLYNWIPEKHMKAKAIKPTVMNVIPKPFRP